jgi:mRNA interferase HigB
MHVISRKALREFWAAHTDAEEPLKRWLKIAERAEWSDFAALRADFPSADLVGRWIVINIGGNKYRLILEVFFRNQVVLIRHVLTHKEYDKGNWKGQKQEAARGGKGTQHGDSIEEDTRSKRNNQDEGRRSRK